MEDNEVALLQVLGGEIDFKFETALNSPDNRALLLDNAQRGQFRLAEVSPSPVVISFDLNLTVEDPIKRQVFRDKNFRIRLSYAMDRQEISDLVYLGQREPYRFAPTPGSYLMHRQHGAPPPDVWVREAGALLVHLHVANNDGRGDRAGDLSRRGVRGSGGADDAGELFAGLPAIARPGGGTA